MLTWDTFGEVLVFLARTIGWFALIMVCTFWVMKFSARKINRQRLKLADAELADLDRLGWRDFEESIRILFERLGYGVENTHRLRDNYDEGADLVITRDGVRTAVQVKQRREGKGKNQVTKEAVGQVLQSLGPYRCSKAMVVTNGTYTSEATKSAAKNGVTLWERRDLAEALVFLNNRGIRCVFPRSWRGCWILRAKSPPTICIVRRPVPLIYVPRATVPCRPMRRGTAENGPGSLEGGFTAVTTRSRSGLPLVDRRRGRRDRIVTLAGMRPSNAFGNLEPRWASK